MGFFDFLKKKEEEEKPVEVRPVSVDFNDLKGEIEKILSEKISREISDLKNLCTEITKQFEEVKKANRSLEGKTFEKGDMTYARINMMKDNYVKKLSGLLGNLPSIREYDHSEIKEFLKRTNSLLKETKTMSVKQAYLLSNYFKTDTGKIIKSLKTIEEKAKDIENILGEGKMKLLRDVELQIGGIEEFKVRLNTLEGENKTTAEKKKELESAKKEKQKELKELLNSEDYKRILGLDDEVERLGKERSRIEHEIREELSAIKRPLKKYEHTFSGELSKNQKNDLDKLIHSPLKALMQENGEMVLKDFLSKIAELVKSGKLMLKDTDVKKINEILDRLNSGEISRLKGKYEDLKSETVAKKTEMEKSDIFEKREKLERELGNLDKEIADSGRSLEGIKKNKESVKKDISGEVRKLEDLIFNETGRKFKIRVF